MSKRKPLKKRIKESHKQRVLKRERQKQANKTWARSWIDFIS